MSVYPPAQVAVVAPAPALTIVHDVKPAATLFTYAVVATLVELSDELCVTAVVPAAKVKAVVLTNASVAISVDVSPAVCVGAVGVPVSAGEARGAKDVATNAVVASLVLLFPALCVGAVGLPVRAGEANGAKEVATFEMGSVTVCFLHMFLSTSAYKRILEMRARPTISPQQLRVARIRWR